ncbi:hypothetical protein PV11_05839 [Exophiala sideris]|uniref:Transcription factor domain-containing protein n=1 Tax=Exophiala sideris TaxID=1016849 RepID=A0A0D1W593_9EURO|nr:hypothetical protein PV11_05839 [Exophiala sideris]
MSASANQHCDFINISGEPNEGRHARRIHVRRTVMTNHHKRKRQKKSLESRKGHTQVLQVPTQAAPLTPACRSEASSFDPQSIRGDISLSVASSSFRLKTNSSPMHTRTCPIIIRFLSGQVIKAVRSLRYVSFIHRHVLGAHGQSNDNLMACSEILCTHYNSSSPNLPMLWHEVSVAQEHIYRTCANLNKWQLLSAAQAITLYILARFRDTTNDGMFPGMDIALLYTMGKLFELIKEDHLRDRNHTHKRGPSPNPTSDWEDWIFHESVNRTATIYFLLRRVATIDFGIECDEQSGWRIEGMLLPSARALWEARDAAMWKTWVDGDVDGQLPALRIGNLLSADADSCQKRQIAIWQEESCEFGIIVMLASQLLMDKDTEDSDP